MNDPRTWFDDDGKPTGVTMPEVYGPEAATEPRAAASSPWLAIGRYMLDLPAHRRGPALAVLLRMAGIDASSLSESARMAGCSRYELRREERHFYSLFQR